MLLLHLRRQKSLQRVLPPILWAHSRMVKLNSRHVAWRAVLAAVINAALFSLLHSSPGMVEVLPSSRQLTPSTPFHPPTSRSCRAWELYGLRQLASTQLFSCQPFLWPGLLFTSLRHLAVPFSTLHHIGAMTWSASLSGQLAPVQLFSAPQPLCVDPHQCGRTPQAPERSVIITAHSQPRSDDRRCFF